MTDAHTLARDYAETSLYRHLREQVQTMIDEANRRDAHDPHEVMKLRGFVEAYQAILSEPFLIMVAQRALIASGEKRPPANPPMDPEDWREPLLAEMGITRNDTVGNA